MGLLDFAKRAISGLSLVNSFGSGFTGFQLAKNSLNDFKSKLNKSSTTSDLKRTSSKVINDTNKNIVDSVTNLKKAYNTSAVKLETDSVKQLNDYLKVQNDLAWQRSESSAQKQMEFQKQQSDLAWERSQSSAQKQMDFQREMYEDQKAYNTEMANSSYQRAVADLRKAGLNPILAVQNGGAVTPNVAIPSGASSSATAMSGAMANASSPSYVKGDYTSAINEDKNASEYKLLGLFTSAFTSAFKQFFSFNSFGSSSSGRSF